MAITLADFDYVSRLAHSEAAIVLEPGKEYLVETRLGPLALQEGFPSLSAFVHRLRSDIKLNGLHQKAVDALTTNETLFFRDYHPFEAMRRELIPEAMERHSKDKRLTLWSAACSTGQEPFSLAMMLLESFPQLAGWNVSILATDLSPTVLKKAGQARFSQFDVNRGLPASYLIKYFTKEADEWRLKDEVKRMIEFRPMNLIQPWPILPSFDFVFLRNVMIYFDVETKKSILRKILGCLHPQGLLFLGSAESTLNIDPAFEPVTFGKAVAYRSVRRP